MKKPVPHIITTFSAFLLCIFNIHSGENLDSIEKLLKKQHGKEKVYSLNNLTYGYHTINPEKAILFGQQALQLAKKINDPQLLANTYNDLSIPYFVIGQYQKSAELNRLSLTIRTELKDTVGMIASYSKLASCLQEMAQYRRAQEINNQAIKLAKLSKNDYYLNHLYLNSAILLEMSGYPEQALTIQLDILEKARHRKDTLGLINTWGNIGSCYRKLKKFKEARKAYLEALKLIQIRKETSNLALVYQGLGVLEREAGNAQAGLNYYFKVYNIYSEMNSPGNKGIIAVNIGNTYNHLGKLDSAAYYLKEGLELVKEIKSYRQIFLAYAGLANLELKQKNYQEAAFLLQQQIKYKDSVALNEGSAILSEMFSKYQVEKKERLLAESRAKVSQAKLQNTIWIGISFLLFILFIIIFLFFRYKRKLAKQELEVKLREEELRRKSELNEQRWEISRELHDNIGSQITYLTSSIDNLTYREDMDQSMKYKLLDLGNFGRNTMTELRTTIWAMNVKGGTVEDLYNKIADLRKFVNVTIDVEIKVPGSYPLSATELLNLYRIIQEFIQNNIKYGNASKISVLLEERLNHLELIITDDGVGFSVADAKGNGLYNMKYRCEQINWEYELHSEIDKGTTLRCKKVEQMSYLAGEQKS